MPSVVTPRLQLALGPAAAAIIAVSLACASSPSTEATTGGGRAPASGETSDRRIFTDSAELAEVFGRRGETRAEEGVNTTSFPRSDLSITVAGRPVPTALGFASWVAFKQGPRGAVAMSDMVLLPEEIDPVISALQESGIEVTALHRHFPDVQPDVMYLHSHASGDAEEIARGYRSALERTGTPLGAVQPPSEEPADVDSAAISTIVGHPGKTAGGVFKITVGRDDLRVRAMGLEVTSSLGLNSWAAFAGAESQARVAGDVAMLEPEVNRVIRALNVHGLRIVSVHNHMLGETPRIVFLHYWGSGPAEELARGFRAALDELGR